MLERRAFLKMAGMAAMGLVGTACDGAGKWKALFGQGESAPPVADWQGTAAERQAAHLLERVTYGPRPGEIKAVVAQGVESFLEAHLRPDSISDSQAATLVRRISAISYQTPEMFDYPAAEILTELRQATLVRAIFSERQLLEVMVEFWNDHFNIFGGKGDCGWLKLADDREVIRPHALGYFRDLLRSSATSPAMLVYLDGSSNRRGNPNENYARELMELHTLGVNGGYSQTDVRELARALTGWQVAQKFRRGAVSLEADHHDGSRTLVLGQELSGSGETELDRIIEITCGHPSTATFLATKLCRRFVSDQPPESLVARVAGRFRESGGYIPSLLREIFLSPEFRSAPPKFKRPYRYAVSALRALGASSDGGVELQNRLLEMGQLPFHWPTPNGYPDTAAAWQAQVLPRWNFACDLAEGRIRGTQVDAAGFTAGGEALVTSFLRRPLEAAEREALAMVQTDAEQVALLLCLPDFQFG